MGIQAMDITGGVHQVSSLLTIITPTLQ